MEYELYLDTILFPVSPEEINIKLKSRNSTFELANQQIYTLVKSPDLTEISFEVLLPNTSYSFAKYTNNKYTAAKSFKNASWFINRWEDLMKNKKPCRFYILRQMGQGAISDPLYLVVTIDSMTIKEKAAEMGDIKVSFTLKKYQDNATKRIIFTSGNKYKIEVTRPLTNTAVADLYTVGTTTDKGYNALMYLAKRYKLSGMSDEDAAYKIYAANKSTIISAAKKSYLDYLKKTYKTTSAAELKKKKVDIANLHKRADYKCYAYLSAKDAAKKKLWKTYTYLVKGTTLKIPVSLIGSKTGG